MAGTPVDHCDWDTAEITPSGQPSIVVASPDLPELELRSLHDVVESGHLVLDGALVEGDGLAPVRADQIRVTESELRGVELEAADTPGLRLSDVILRSCDLSNLDGREGSLRRVEIRDSRLMGFGLAGGELQDVMALDSSLAFASLAFSKIKAAIFERVDLTDASFMEAQLEAVAFVDCKLAGTDFRGARVRNCMISGTSLEGVLGVESLRGLRMPWVDVVESARALAEALGISVDPS